MIKVIKDILLLVFLFIAASNISKAEEGGVRLENGCYTLILLLDQEDGSKQIKTIVDCRGGRPI